MKYFGVLIVPVKSFLLSGIMALFGLLMVSNTPRHNSALFEDQTVGSLGFGCASIETAVVN